MEVLVVLRLHVLLGLGLDLRKVPASRVLVALQSSQLVLQLRLQQQVPA